ncbi:response regulator [bacterium]|nr:response regulator [bacterium]
MINILICDDNKFSRNKISEILRKRNYFVDTATRLPEVIKKFSENRYDLVLLDIHIDGMSGLSPVHVLHSISPDISIIAISEDPSEETLTKTINLPSVIAYFIYPLDTQELIGTVEKFKNKLLNKKIGVLKK